MSFPWTYLHTNRINVFKVLLFMMSKLAFVSKMIYCVYWDSISVCAVYYIRPCKYVLKYYIIRGNEASCIKFVYESLFPLMKNFSFWFTKLTVLITHTLHKGIHRKGSLIIKKNSVWCLLSMMIVLIGKWSVKEKFRWESIQMWFLSTETVISY